MGRCYFELTDINGKNQKKLIAFNEIYNYSKFKYTVGEVRKVVGLFRPSLNSTEEVVTIGHRNLAT